MRKIIYIAMFLVVIAQITTEANARMPLEPVSIGGYRTDTLMLVDTIIRKEIINRTEEIHRSEKLVRYYDGERIIEKKIDDSSRKEPLSEERKDQGEESSEISIPGPDHGTEFADTIFREGGKYVWIPDSVEFNINEAAGFSSLAENSNAKQKKDKEDTIDLNEKVIFRGDTINMVLKDRNLGRYDRGLFNFLFIPKGIWQVGMTASYGEFSTSNLEILDLISDIDFNGKLWSIKPYFQYFIKSNISIGMRLGFTHGIANVGSFNVDIDEDMSFNLHDIMYKSNSYSASLTFSQYLGIARKGRFGVFNEVELAFAGGDSDFNRPYNREMRKTHTTTFQTSLNFSPGVCVYVLDPVSFNVSLGVFGLNIKHEKQKVNGEKLGSRTTSGANFRFNIFNINFGIAINI